MKVIRTKIPVEIGDRTKRNAIVAVAITEWAWQERLNRFKAIVTDFEVMDNASIKPGDPLKTYVPLGESKVLFRTPTEVNQVFNFFGVPIEMGDDYTMKTRDLIVKGLLLETQQEPIYNTTSEDWEIIDTEKEVVPNE